MPGSYFGTASESFGNALVLSVVLMLLLQKSSSLSNVDPATKGIQILKQRKAESRVNRITDLLSEESTLSSANQKELSSLLSCDTYDPNSFTEAHRTFKDNHNEIFASLGNNSGLSSFCSLHFSWIHLFRSKVFRTLSANNSI